MPFAAAAMDAVAPAGRRWWLQASVTCRRRCSYESQKTDSPVNCARRHGGNAVNITSYPEIMGNDGAERYAFMR